MQASLSLLNVDNRRFLSNGLHGCRGIETSNVLSCEGVVVEAFVE